MSGAVVHLGGRAYRVAPDLRLVREIETELGSLPALAARLEEGRWVAGELVALVQMFLQSAGRTVDYARLGEQMIAEGLARHAAAARAVLGVILEGRGA